MLDGTKCMLTTCSVLQLPLEAMQLALVLFRSFFLGKQADFFLFGGFESFEDILPRCVDSALDDVRLRDGRDGNGVFSAVG